MLRTPAARATLMAATLACTTGMAHATPVDIAYGPARDQTLSVYAPPGPHDAPIVVMVHGGAWLTGDKDNPGVAEPKASHWNQAGAIFVNVDYRLVPSANPLQQAGDVAAALAYVQHHARAWHGDPSRIVLMGHSAGAHLVSLVAVTPALQRAAGVQPWLGTVALDSAAVDLVSLMEAPHPFFYNRVFGRDPAGWAAMSPYARMDSAPAGPMLMVCSSLRDNSCSANERFADKARHLGGRVDVMPEPLRHMDIDSQLGAPNDYTAAVDRWLKAIM